MNQLTDSNRLTQLNLQNKVFNTAYSFIMMAPTNTLVPLSKTGFRLKMVPIANVELVVV